MSNIVSFVLRGKNRVKVLKILSKEKKISGQIEKETGMYKSHVSRTLKELMTKNLIKCLNPKDRTYRFYTSTSEGKRLIKIINQILKDLN